MTSTPLTSWPARIRRTIAQSGGRHFKRVFVCTETNSTQDAAKRMRAKAGDVITCGRQSGGRGRRGRAWADTGDDGLAVTFVLNRADPERLAIAAAVATASAIESILQRPVGIKWPNDVQIGPKKVAGILVERRNDLAYLGIGINVTQTDWPPDLASKATSIRQSGVTTDRLDVLEVLIGALAAALELDEGKLIEEFHSRDALTGRRAAFQVDREIVTGAVVSVDPLKEIVIDTESGRRTLPAAATMVLSVESSNG